MRIIDVRAESEPEISEFESLGARAKQLADGRGESHVYVVHFDAGGVIGPHPTGLGQIFLVLSGSGWVAGADGQRHSLTVGQAALIERGELHSKGSDVGLDAVMIQIEELES